MYIIETHYRHRVATQLVFEPGDGKKTYDEFSQYRTITNHAGDVDTRFCEWCLKSKETHIKRREV